MTQRLPEDLVASLVDPETREPLRAASEPELQQLKSRMSAGQARRKDGGELPTAFDGAFITRDGKHVYLVLDGIPNFLIDERIELDEAIEETR